MAFDRLRGFSTVILDSSAVLMIFEFSVDLEAELVRLIGKYRIVVPRPVLTELQVLSLRRGGKKKQIAKAAVKFVERFEVVDTRIKSADDAVFDLAQTVEGVVVTNDRELRNRLREASLPVVFLRGKKMLVLEGSINW